MATAHLITGAVSDKPVTADPAEQQAYLNKEVAPFLKESRTKVNAFLERPHVPKFTSIPVTDLDFDAHGTRPLSDDFAYLAIGGDNRLYVRLGGVWLSTALT